MTLWSPRDVTRSGCVRAFGPGRVNLIGEHTDYNDGLCLPFAVEMGVVVEAQASPDGTIHARAEDLGEDDVFAIEAPERSDGWRAFVRGTVAELGRAGHSLQPASLTVSGNVPRGSGLSSSAALEVALALALLAFSGCPEPDRRSLARLCSRVENEWVGAQTGLLDQLAALYGRSGHALRLDTAPRLRRRAALRGTFTCGRLGPAPRGLLAGQRLRRPQPPRRHACERHPSRAGVRKSLLIR